MKRDTLNIWTRWVNDAGCTRCFQHKDLQRKMLQSTLKDTDALDVVDLVDLHGRFRHNRASTSASHHLNLPLHNSPCNSGRLQASPSIGPWIKHIKPVLILLRPDPRKPETLLQPGYIWLHWNQLKVLAKGFRPAGEFCGHLPGRCDTLRIDTVYCQKRKDGKLVECNDFLDLLQICVQSLKHGNISDPSSSHEHWFT